MHDEGGAEGYAVITATLGELRVGMRRVHRAVSAWGRPRRLALVVGPCRQLPGEHCRIAAKRLER